MPPSKTNYISILTNYISFCNISPLKKSKQINPYFYLQLKNVTFGFKVRNLNSHIKIKRNCVQIIPLLAIISRILKSIGGVFCFLWEMRSY